jgi:septum formation topological specificity factor MinE
MFLKEKWLSKNTARERLKVIIVVVVVVVIKKLMKNATQYIIKRGVPGM